MCSTNTHFAPGNKNKQRLDTWQSTGNGTYKQLDYITISNTQKNWTAQTKIKGAANPDSQHRHQMLLPKLRIRIRTEQTRSEAKQVQFDIDNLRAIPTLRHMELTAQQTGQIPPNQDTLAADRTQKQTTHLKNGTPRHGPISHRN